MRYGIEYNNVMAYIKHKSEIEFANTAVVKYNIYLTNRMRSFITNNQLPYHMTGWLNHK